MKLFFFIVISLLAQVGINAQSSFNFDMEVIDDSTKLPKGWSTYDYKEKRLYAFSLDSTAKYQGKYSMSITSIDSAYNMDATSMYTVKANYPGKKITLKGFLRTENVNGYAGLWMHVGGGYKNWGVSDGDTKEKGLKGSNDWQLVSLELAYDPEDATVINFGAVLEGSGKMWLDKVTLEFDGKDIAIAPTKSPHIYFAKFDTAFRHGSGISTLSLGESQKENITNLGMLWGFLKYHHPDIAKGNYNWDAELFRILPQVIDAKDKKEANKTLEDWVDKLGKPEKCLDCKVINKDKIIKALPDYGNLFQRGNLSASLVSKLNYLLSNHNIGKHYYIRRSGNVVGSTAGIPLFQNEESYSNMLYPDAGYRLLALYRYWNIIQYFYPHKYSIGEDWNKVLPEFIPKFLQASDSTSYLKTCFKLISRIKDSHAQQNKNLYLAWGKFLTPLQVKFLNNKLVVTGYYTSDSAIKEKIKLGDEILKIDGVTVKKRIDELLLYTSASNHSTALRNTRFNVLRGSTPSVLLEILRNGKITSINVVRVEVNKLNLIIDRDPAPPEGSYKIINGDIGYLFPGKYKNEQLSKIKETFKNTKGLIIDFRCYPSDFMPFTFGSYLKPIPSPFARFTQINTSTPGLITFSAAMNNGEINTDYYKGKVIIIVNELTQSQAELTVIAFQSAPNVIVIGSTTAGALTHVSEVVLPGNFITNISGTGEYYMDGSETQRVGVKIDVTVKPTIKGIKEGRDELLEKAIAMIQRNK